jgi:hypothetical protein
MIVRGAAHAACRRTKATTSKRGAAMSNIDTLTRSRRIRVLNDNFRAAFLGGRVVITPAVAELPIDVKAHAFIQMQRFADFNSDNDPHGEHDFGSFELAGETFFWKIDYYDRDMMFGSEDPADPEKTTRVLTIMLSHEY